MICLPGGVSFLCRYRGDSSLIPNPFEQSLRAISFPRLVKPPIAVQIAQVETGRLGQMVMENERAVLAAYSTPTLRESRQPLNGHGVFHNALAARVYQLAQVQPLAFPNPPAYHWKYAAS
ncbi:hypothetical protein G7Y89_g7771 [Cudoniella acicularis]|uniref:Uncharacterized protein n=1 Tax=Cudoniella acicularis TaxID=354080 RepID=A0A8H4RKB4_9HELO|nr:hypothetical protein G7Y89_g7771 [Cudoniella acicularis]